MLNLFEIYQEAFDCVCYDTESEKVIDDSVYYFNYNKITKLYLFQKKGNYWDYLLFDKFWKA